MPSLRLMQTGDGSWTCYNEAVREHYHNLSGAYAEANRVYGIPSELERRLETGHPVTVLDPFMGLGYNTLVCFERFCRLREERFPEARLTLVAFESDPQILAHLPQVIANSDQDDLKRFLTLFEHNIYYRI